MRTALSFVLATLLTITLVGTASPAHAAINRCGDAYTRKTDWYSFSGDTHRPRIVKFRLRAVPGTQRVCAEFSRFNREDFRTKNAQIQVFQGGDTKKVCFALSCKFKTGYKTTKFLFAVMAKKRGTSQPFYSYSDNIRLTY